MLRDFQRNSTRMAKPAIRCRCMAAIHSGLLWVSPRYPVTNSKVNSAISAMLAPRESQSAISVVIRQYRPIELPDVGRPRFSVIPAKAGIQNGYIPQNDFPTETPGFRLSPE